MKIPTATKLNSFINAADGGSPVSEKKTATGKSCINLTPKQREVFDKIRNFANESSVYMLFFLALEYSKENPFEYSEYTAFLKLLKDKSSDSFHYPYEKGTIYQEYKDITATIKKSWLNIPLKGVILMHLLHYVKNKYGMNIDEFKN